MGQVRRVFDRRLGRKVALKQLRPDMDGGARQRQRFIQEAQIQSALKHPNILEVRDVREANGRLFIVSEYVDGRTLGEVIDMRQQLRALVAGSLAEG